MWRAGQPRCRVRRGGGAGPRLRDLPPALTRQSPTREPRNYSGSVGLVRRLVPGWRRPSSPRVSGAGRCCSPMWALTTSTTPARVGIARCSGLGWRWAVATFSGCRHWGRRHPWTRTAPSGRAGPQHQQARPPQRPWRYAGVPDGRRQRPGKTAVRTALSPRYLIRMRPEVQVLPGPPLSLTSGNAGPPVRNCLGPAHVGSRTLTWLLVLVLQSGGDEASVFKLGRVIGPCRFGNR